MVTCSDSISNQIKFEMNTSSSFYADSSVFLVNSSLSNHEQNFQIQEINKLFGKLSENQRKSFLSSLIKV